MAPPMSPETERRYLLSLRLPTHLKAEVEQYREQAVQNGCLNAPLPPLLPLVERKEFLPPFPLGHLPPATTALHLNKTLITKDSWVILPLQIPPWLQNWAQKLQEPKPCAPRMFPLLKGIPLTYSLGQNSVWTPALQGWRTLILDCWSMDFAVHSQPCLPSVTWKHEWSRRAKKAPKETNNNKKTDLAS